MTNPQDTIPYGFCRCGCGEKTSIAQRHNPRLGHIRGEPTFYLPGHHRSKGGIDNYVVEDRGYETPCWIWQGYLTVDGYGRCKLNGKVVGVHVAMFEREVGPIPEGLELDHLCRVRHCLNPLHVEPVNDAENARRGLSAKLDISSVQSIKLLLPTHSDASLGNMFDISPGTIWWIRKGIRWKDVT